MADDLSIITSPNNFKYRDFKLNIILSNRKRLKSVNWSSIYCFPNYTLIIIVSFVLLAGLLKRTLAGFMYFEIKWPQKKLTAKGKRKSSQPRAALSRPFHKRRARGTWPSSLTNRTWPTRLRGAPRPRPRTDVCGQRQTAGGRPGLLAKPPASNLCTEHRPAVQRCTR